MSRTVRHAESRSQTATHVRRSSAGPEGDWTATSSPPAAAAGRHADRGPPTRGVTSDAGAGDTTCGDVGAGWLPKAEKRRLFAPAKRLRGVERPGCTGGRGSAAAACCSPRRRSSSWYPPAMVCYDAGLPSSQSGPTVVWGRGRLDCQLPGHDTRHDDETERRRADVTTVDPTRRGLLLSIVWGMEGTNASQNRLKFR